MFFRFENNCQSTEALITALKYDKIKAMYEITVFGLDRDGFSYTEPGKAWFDDEEFDELTGSQELEFPHNIIGRKMKLIGNNWKGNGEQYGEE